MTNALEWRHRDDWSLYGDNFLIVVSRHSVELSPFDRDEGQHRWAMYAYIYPGHRLFEDFHGPDMWQPAATALPLHGGPSLLRWHYDDNHNPTSVQVGADYHHIGDSRFSRYATMDDAYEVFADAEKLFDYLERR